MVRSLTARTTRVGLGLSAVLLVAVAPACGDEDGGSGGAGATGGTPARAATAEIAPLEDSGVQGTAEFSVAGEEVTLSITIEGGGPGEHGLHIHQNGVCEGDGTSAGDHWNPEGHMHGHWNEGEFHLGDIGNITLDAAGRGSLTLTTTRWSVGDGAPTDVVGHAVILHADPDDLASQPSGNAGARIACGVIE
ncbi:superoxide dismutase family protein [Chondromyces crocatus]|uniref:Superoxide dismutase [Cu-Zn] n=1 Tax=Chondromyces crocatus TaxID=52 RepID=A0A0K1ED85_CHOCO|nr:superoxide dismutase family protein [Chondromyces crocatus]AKT38809.1 uncharacterized protein CMC5_029550 [Chondromyces crocatus]